MTGNSKRSIRLLSWRTLRWVATLPALPLVWWACTSHPLAQPTPAPEQQTNIYITVKPNRQLDLLFMVDNSPSMAPKQAKMNAQFPKLIEALKDPTDQSLPDLRVAIIDSDLGTGGRYTSGSCGPTKNGGSWGDQGHFQMIGATDCHVNSADALFLEYKAGAPVNYTGDINTVFACLASNLGTAGCGEEHQLEAFEWAIAVGVQGNEAQQSAPPTGFLRPAAYLGLVFLSDEDDCSAATNDGMFGTRPFDLNGVQGPDLSAEAPSLRCYTRSHMCSGKNLSDSGPGYPTTQPFKTALTNCSARTDACLNPTDGDPTKSTDTALPTSCSPLKSVKVMADHLKAKKSSPDQILVAGIYGWPLNDADLAKAEYKIDQTTNPNTDPNHPTLFDSWPICYDPNHPAPKDGTFSSDAAGFGATAGLRMSAFIDEFGTNGLKFSICQLDFSDSMKLIGDTLRKKLTNLCVDYKLYDTDTTPGNGLQPSCRVVYRTPDTSSGTLKWTENPNSLPECGPNDTAANLAVGADCWKLTQDTTRCPTTGQLIEVVRSTSSVALPDGTQVGMQCRTCTDFKAPDGSEAAKACNY